MKNTVFSKGYEENERGYVDMHKILTYAYHYQLRIWSDENDRANAMPGNEYTKERERRAWDEVKTIENELLKLEKAIAKSRNQ